MDESAVEVSMTLVWMRVRMASSWGFPGRKRKDFAALRRVRRIFHAEDKV